MGILNELKMSVFKDLVVSCPLSKCKQCCSVSGSDISKISNHSNEKKAKTENNVGRKHMWMLVSVFHADIIFGKY